MPINLSGLMGKNIHLRNREYSENVILYFCLRISAFSVISRRTGTIFFGGFDTEEDLEIQNVAQYKSSVWIQLGELAQPRYAHKSIIINDHILILGGNSKKYESRRFPSAYFVLRNIEIWENLGDDLDEIFIRKQISESSFTFNGANYGEAVRSNRNDCEKV